MGQGAAGKARRQQRRRLDVEQRPAERLGDGAAKRAEHAQADDGVGILAGGVGILGHLQGDGAEHGAHGPHRLERIGPARLHEFAAGVARHDLLHIAAQGTKGDAVPLDKGGEILRRGQTHAITRRLQATRQGDAWLDVAARAGGEDGEFHDWYDSIAGTSGITPAFCCRLNAASTSWFQTCASM